MRGEGGKHHLEKLNFAHLCVRSITYVVLRMKMFSEITLMRKKTHVHTITAVLLKINVFHIRTRFIYIPWRNV